MECVLGLPPKLERTGFLLLGVKTASCPSGRVCNPRLPDDSISGYPNSMGPRETPYCFHMSMPRRSQTKSKQESSGPSEPLLREHSPFLATEDTGEKKLIVCCPFSALLPVGSGKQLAIQALGLHQSPAGMCSIPAGRMGCPGRDRKGFHFPPPKKTQTTLFSFKVSS